VVERRADGAAVSAMASGSQGSTRTAVVNRARCNPYLAVGQLMCLAPRESGRDAELGLLLKLTSERPIEL
jgi:hypothetical protein